MCQEKADKSPNNTPSRQYRCVHSLGISSGIATSNGVGRMEIAGLRSTIARGESATSPIGFRQSSQCVYTSASFQFRAAPNLRERYHAHQQYIASPPSSPRWALLISHSKCRVLNRRCVYILPLKRGRLTSIIHDAVIPFSPVCRGGGR